MNKFFGRVFDSKLRVQDEGRCGWSWEGIRRWRSGWRFPCAAGKWKRPESPCISHTPIFRRDSWAKPPVWRWNSRFEQTKSRGHTFLIGIGWDICPCMIGAKRGDNPCSRDHSFCALDLAHLVFLSYFANLRSLAIRLPIAAKASNFSHAICIPPFFCRLKKTGIGGPLFRVQHQSFHMEWLRCVRSRAWYWFTWAPEASSGPLGALKYSLRWLGSIRIAFLSVLAVVLFFLVRILNSSFVRFVEF